MFKVPDWGSDIPASNVDLTKVLNKKHNNIVINKGNPKLKTTVTKEKNKSDNANKIGKPKNGFVKKQKNQTILSRDDHIKNRMLKRSLKNSSETTEKRSGTTGLNHNIQNKLKMNISVNGVNSKINNKNLKSQKRIAKSTISNKNNNQRRPESDNEKNAPENNSNPHIKNQKSRKRKHKQNDAVTNDTKVDSIDMENLNTDEPDKLLVNAKRKKLNEKIENEDIEDDLFGNEVVVQNKSINKNKTKFINHNNKENDHKPSPKEKYLLQKKKEQIKAMLNRDSNRNIINTSGDKLRVRMMERLKAAQFRYLNEKLYTSSGSESQELFKSDPAAFQTYHEGYQLQVKKWPVNPLDLIVKRIQKMPKTHLIADMGCGEAALSKRVPNTVRSFDLVATVPGVEACNMAHTPLLTASVDAVVYCLALMGTDLTQYLLEANRVLKIGGHLLIAEVESRFENVESFSSDVQRLGFSLKKMDKTHNVFFFMEFTKVRDAPAKKNKLPALSLKPCLYKRR